jgi:nucleoside-diphosphate-sugar epimerase
MLRYSADTVRSALEIAWGDLRDPDSVGRFVQNADIVFHLGALVGIPYSYAAPQQYVETNVLGTLNVLQAVTRRGIPMVQTSTSEVYGTPQSVPISELHPLQAQSPYAATKIAADKLAESFHRTYATKVATIRPFNAYGPRQSLRAVVPTIIVQALRGSDVRIGKLDPVRDLNYVDDLVDAFLAIGTAEACIGTVTNVGTGIGRSVGDLIAAVSRLIGRPLHPIVEETRVRPRESEVERLIADASKAERLLGWKPTTAFDDGLRATVDWFATQPLQTDVYRFTV